MGSEIVMLNVGPEKKVYAVHKLLLRKKIDYFDKMFSSDWKESSTNTASFPEDNVASFDLLIEWVYNGKVRPLKFLRQSESFLYCWRPILFWQLAEKFCIPKLQDQIMNAWITLDATTKGVHSPEITRQAYEVTPAGSAPRRYVLHSMVWNVVTRPESSIHPTSQFQELLSSLPELLADFLSAVHDTAKNPPKSARKLPLCDFHVHERSAVCPHTGVGHQGTSSNPFCLACHERDD